VGPCPAQPRCSGRSSTPLLRRVVGPVWQQTPTLCIPQAFACPATAAGHTQHTPTQLLCGHTTSPQANRRHPVPVPSPEHPVTRSQYTQTLPSLVRMHHHQLPCSSQDLGHSWPWYAVAHWQCSTVALWQMPNGASWCYCFTQCMSPCWQAGPASALVEHSHTNQITALSQSTPGTTATTFTKSHYRHNTPPRWSTPTCPATPVLHLCAQAEQSHGG
jgi:hypothetical protein